MPEPGAATDGPVAQDHRQPSVPGPHRAQNSPAAGLQDKRAAAQGRRRRQRRACQPGRVVQVPARRPRRRRGDPGGGGRPCRRCQEQRAGASCRCKEHTGAAGADGRPEGIPALQSVRRQSEEAPLQDGWRDIVQHRLRGEEGDGGRRRDAAGRAEQRVQGEERAALGGAAGGHRRLSSGVRSGQLAARRRRSIYSPSPRIRSSIHPSIHP